MPSREVKNLCVTRASTGQALYFNSHTTYYFYGMPEPVKYTAAVLLLKAYNRNVDATWIKWAEDMLYAGFDTEHLRILAGETPPYEQPYLQRLTTKVFDELHFSYADKEHARNTYICYLLHTVTTGEAEIFSVLATLKDLYVELGYDNDLEQFYLLYFAKDTLLDSEMQCI